MTKLTTIAVEKKVAVAAKLAGERRELPLSPLPEVHPPAVFEPRPMRTPATIRIGGMAILAPPGDVPVSHPEPWKSGPPATSANAMPPSRIPIANQPRQVSAAVRPP